MIFLNIKCQKIIFGTFLDQILITLLFSAYFTHWSLMGLAQFKFF